MNPFDNFPHIYCINLDRRPDRWLQSQAEFASIGIADRVQRFPGVDLPYGKEGCKASFLSLFKMAVANQWPHVVIFEDDVKFINNPIETLNKAIQQTQGVKWDMMYLGASIIVPMSDFTENTYKLNGAYAAHAVIYSLDILPEIINQFEATGPVVHFDTLNDYILSQIQLKSLSLVCNPICAVQRAGYSDLENKVTNYDWMEAQFNSHKP